MFRIYEACSVYTKLRGVVHPSWITRWIGTYTLSYVQMYMRSSTFRKCETVSDLRNIYLILTICPTTLPFRNYESRHPCQSFVIAKQFRIYEAFALSRDLVKCAWVWFPYCPLHFGDKTTSKIQKFEKKGQNFRICEKWHFVQEIINGQLGPAKSTRRHWITYTASQSCHFSRSRFSCPVLI